MQSSAAAIKLDRLFFALSDANRRAMIDRLCGGPASVSDLAKRLDIALPSALKHLAVLEDGGIVRSKKTGRVRTYEMTPKILNKLETWVAGRKKALNVQFDALEKYLEEQGE